MPDLSDFARDFEYAIQKGMNDANQAALDLAKKKSSGTLSYSQLAAMDYPYARRHGTPQTDPSTINVHSGSFRGAWHLASIVENRSVVAFTILNDSYVADFLRLGTSKMFARPVGDVVEAEALPLVESAIEARLSAMLSQTYS